MTRCFKTFAAGTLALLLAGALPGCRSRPGDVSLNRFSFQGAHMGTGFTITLYAPNAALAENAAAAAFQRVAELEDILSDYQADSELNRLREKPVGQPVEVGEDLFAVARVAQDIAAASGGAFDITAGPYVRLWRFSRKRHTLPTPVEIARAREAVGWQKLRLDPRKRTLTLLAPGMQLDAGGIAKGYAADEALAVLKRFGCPRALVAASGDIAIGDPPPGTDGWKIGIAAMNGPTNAHTVWLKKAGVSTSGDAEQSIEIDGVRYAHIVNPATGLGLTNRIQATIIAPNATLSDALATTVCIRGPRESAALLRKFPGTSAVVFSMEDGQVRETRLGKRRD